MAGADVAKIVAKKIIDKKIDMFNEKYIPLVIRFTKN